MDPMQQQQGMMQMPMTMGYTSMTARKNEVLSALRELINADEIVENVRFQLSGKKVIRRLEGNQEISELRQYHPPLMNDDGVSSIVSDFRAFITANTILSWYEAEEITRWSKTYFTNIIFELARNMKKYDVRSRENHAKIRMILHSNFRSVLGRALRGMTIITALKNIDVHEVRNFEEQNKPGLLGMFKRGGQ